MATMEHSDKATVRRVHAMLTQACTSTRHRVLKLGAVSQRFKVRAVAGILPTHLHEYKRSREGNAYDYIYGDAIDGGRCVCALAGRCTRAECCCSAVEDMTHATAGCPVSEHIREHARARVDALWADGHAETEASTRYISVPPPGWLPEWTWMGMVPRSVTERASRLAQSRIHTAAVILAKAGVKVWEARNEEAVKWGDATGVTARKTEVRRRQWTQVPRRRTGRPRKTPDDLEPAYRQLLQRRHHFAEAAAAGVPIASAKAKWRMRMIADIDRIGRQRASLIWIRHTATAATPPPYQRTR